MTPNDQYWMARALRLAARGLYTAHPNPRVGCVLVRDGELVAEGWHERTGGDHAEAAALKLAGPNARGCTAYVSLEPCCHHGRTPPCAQALVAAGVERVVVGAPDPNPRVDGGGIELLREAGLEVTEGVLEAECAALNVGFHQRMTNSRPWVRVKLASSLDGRTALADGRSQWISGEASRADVQRWRARSSAILTGIGTVLADNPSLNVRDPALAAALQPERIIVDSALRMPVDAKLLGLPGQVRIFCAEAPDAARSALESAGAVVESLPNAGAQGRSAQPFAAAGRTGNKRAARRSGPVTVWCPTGRGPRGRVAGLPGGARSRQRRARHVRHPGADADDRPTGI
jgi:diaminohydroxyphosphoribosylaminopyrimidine deaminase/5-amino-6-(5-phosphoribosylamino)uracil reductase